MQRNIEIAIESALKLKNVMDIESLHREGDLELVIVSYISWMRTFAMTLVLISYHGIGDNEYIKIEKSRSISDAQKIQVKSELQSILIVRSASSWQEG